MTKVNQHIDEPYSLLVQISDTHLCADPKRSLRGINTYDCLKAVLKLASDHLQQASLIMTTGDISHDGSSESYSFFEEQLRKLSGVKRLLPGNHDQPDILCQLMSQPNWPTVDQLGSWRVIGLDSHLTGESAGYLATDKLADLKLVLAEAEHAHQPVLLALHHPPIPTGSCWLDEISLINQSEFRQLLSDFKQVRAIIFGHAHQEMDETRDGIRWLCCPSTCVQFLPNTQSAYSDTLLPGYRWIRLYQDGKIETGVERISEWPYDSGPDRRKWS